MARVSLYPKVPGSAPGLTGSAPGSEEARGSAVHTHTQSQPDRDASVHPRPWDAPADLALSGRPVPTLPTPSPGGGSDHVTSRAPLCSVKPPSFPAPTLPCKCPYVLKTHFPCQVLGWVFTRACSVGVSLRGRESTIRPLGSSRQLWWEMPGATAPRGLESVSRTAPSTGLQRPPAPLGLSTQGSLAGCNTGLPPEM